MHANFEESTHPAKIDFEKEHLSLIIDTIVNNGGSARVVGGAVRDFLLGKNSSDIDIATTLQPDQIAKLFAKKPFSVILAGSKYGMVLVKIGCEQYEITTLRRDVQTDGRYALVEYIDDFALDAARRDFTINALSYDLHNHTIYDYFSGINDVKGKIVRFIGDANLRIEEDYLRIFRFFRFTANFASSVDRAGLCACINHIDMIKKISVERIKSEMDKLLIAPKVLIVLREMAKHKFLEQIFPTSQISCDLIDKLVEKNTLSNILPSRDVLYAIILHRVSNLDKDYLLKRRFTRKQAKIIMGFCSLLQSKDNCIVAITKLWLQDFDPSDLYFFCLVVMNISEVRVERDLHNWFVHYRKKIERPELPVNAQDIISLGYRGVEIGKKLEIAYNIWTEQNLNISKDQLIIKLQQ